MSDSSSSDDNMLEAGRTTYRYAGGLEELQQLRQTFVNRAGVTLYRGPRGYMHVVNYDAKLFSSIGVCFTCIGTVFSRPRIWIEMLLLLVLFLLVAAVSCMRKEALVDSEIESHLLPEKLFQVATFLLAFYTSLCVSRWWNLRTDGINNIMQTSSELSLFLYTFVTKDPQVLSAVTRYARASLEIISMERRHCDDLEQIMHDLDYLNTINILTQDEVQALKKCGNNPAEAIWAWTFQIINDLIQAGKIPNGPFQCSLIGIVNNGRASVSLIRALLDCPVPMPYVHLLGVLVKMSNICSAFTFGVMWGVHGVSKDNWEQTAVTFAFTAGRALLVPMMFNAILTINADLSDPFSADVNDFPVRKYQLTMESDSKSYIMAAQALPPWLRKGSARGIPKGGGWGSSDDGGGD